MKNIILHEGGINGSGVLETPCYAKSKIEGRFYIGAYTFISHFSKIKNCFIGRFGRVEECCLLGVNKEKKGSFSNHFFNYAENGPFRNDDYYQSIKPDRFFYEKEKITLIGNDVFIHSGVTVYSGVSIGDGVVIYPNSIVEDDVPDYAIVAGIPARLIGYRFPEDIIRIFTKTRWWDFDLSSFLNKKNVNLINNIKLLTSIADAGLPKKNFDAYYYNDFNGELMRIKKEKVIVGPSHIYIWQKSISSGQFTPHNYFLLGIMGASSYSENLKKAIRWLSHVFDMVYFFVPDFRIGNASLISDEQDGVFIDPLLMNNENDLICYQHGIRNLDDMATIENIKYIFWCLSGREKINKKNDRFVFNESYKHPIWNLNELKERYKNKIILVEDLGIDILEHTLDDGTIHPNDDGIALLHAHFDKQAAVK